MSRLSHQHSNAKATTAYATDTKPRKSSRVLAKSTVPCPDCGADVGDSCVRQDGTPTNSHRVRLRMAVRLNNEIMQDWDLVLWAKSVTFKERRAARQRAGLTHQQIGDMCAVSESTARGWFHSSHPALNESGARFAKWLRGEVSR